VLPKPNEYAIYPGLAIARLGPSSWVSAFVGPEFPDPDFAPPGLFGRTYRTPLGNIRRQIARFRVYRVKWRRFRSGWIPRTANEVTAAGGFTLRWTVTIANCKSFDHTVSVDGFVVPPLDKSDRIRNQASGQVSGVNQLSINLKGNATWPADPRKKADLLLAQIGTDEKGRLLFAAGEGESRDVEGAGRPLNGLFHMGWFDDVCDGSVECEVVDPDGATTSAERAWIVAGPPAYAHQIGHLVSLYDVAETLAIAARRWPRPNVSVAHHIFPVLRTTERQRWVSTSAQSHRDAPDPKDDFNPFDDEGILRKPGSVGALPAVDHRSKRRKISNRLKHPSLPRSAGRKLPWLPHWYPVSGGMVENVFDKALNAIISAPQGNDMPLQAGLPFVREQWLRFRYWSTRDAASGIWDFPAGIPPVPGKLEDLDPVEQLDALNRAHLGSMVGGSATPGIEVGWKALEPSSWGYAFRPSDSLQPGDLTFTLSIPWPTDFFACAYQNVSDPDNPVGFVSNVWWPAARPIEVFPDSNNWHRGVVVTSGALSDVDWWKSRGFIAKSGAQFEETEGPPP
jgi:hypothetical protein